ncbi:hypothetical protein [Pontiella sulfatireligans]|uniref:Uncharacterized protein n=1 Tax=Pontiella sulfatireligans TaxID=2750658 RepID=A0A6C2UUE2_9BACT|nr:hypothetical protein [Pontiella sulfatireligans]VGO22777.1 hypothetical protein SCARR_04874 [Pontiella sulfatireligans]
MEEKRQAHAENKDANDVILDLNFVPQWAKKPPGENHYGQKEYSSERRAPRRDDRRPPRRDDQRDDRPRRPRPERSDRPERTERPRAPRETFKELPLSISFLPEQQRLASLVRQIHHSRRAYPLIDLANLLIQDAEGYLVKIEVSKGAPAGFEMLQCKRCKAVAISEEMMVQHVMSMHLADFYEKEEIETDPPSGSFPGVARCRKSGILLGPPNHHSYTEKLNAVHQSRFAHLSFDEYKRSIEIVRDEEVIEQWKEESRKQTVYKLKSDPEAEPVELRKAELEFAKKVPSLYEATPRAVVPAKVAQELGDRDITHAIRQVWTKESRFPLSMSFAMRAAFRHMHLYLFKAGKINFVTHIKPYPVKPENTVENIAEVLSFLKEHPGSSRLQLLEVLHPSLDPASQEAKDALKPLGWLIERGHIIEFFNGTLSVPLGRGRR